MTILYFEISFSTIKLTIEFAGSVTVSVPSNFSSFQSLSSVVENRYIVLKLKPFIFTF